VDTYFTDRAWIRGLQASLGVVQLARKKWRLWKKDRVHARTSHQDNLEFTPFFRIPLTPTSIIVSFVCRTKWIELNISALLLHLGAILPAVLLPPLALHIRSFISNFMYNVSCFRAFGSLTNCKCTQGLFTELLCLIDSKAYQTAGPVLADGGSEDLS